MDLRVRSVERSALLRHPRQTNRPRDRDGELSQYSSRARIARDWAHHVRIALAEDSRGDRSALPDVGLRDVRFALPAAGMEMQCAERAFPQGREPSRLPLRG